MSRYKNPGTHTCYLGCQLCREWSIYREGLLDGLRQATEIANRHIENIRTLPDAVNRLPGSVEILRNDLIRTADAIRAGTKP